MLTLAYEPGTVLHDISLYAKPGQKVALLAQQALVKQPLLTCSNRFYDIEDGKIRYDGINGKD